MINLSKVFERFRETNLKVQLDKSEFLQREVAFLGHIITSEGIQPNPQKIEAILKYTPNNPIPRTTKEIKGFLGLLGYYRKFIKDFAKITKPLTFCLKKNQKIEHTPKFIECFETCKNLLVNEPLLQYPDFTKPFNLTTDASNFAIGAILLQGPIGKDKPIAYASRTLNESEQNYTTIEKEMLAMVWATKYFRPYLFGQKFKILSDHRPLQWLFSLKDPNSKLVRWRLKLEEFDYEIVYKKAKSNTNADALSRIEVHTKEAFSLKEYIENFNKELEENASLYNNAPSENTVTDQSQRRISEDTSATDTADENPDRLQQKRTSSTDTADENPDLDQPKRTSSTDTADEVINDLNQPENEGSNRTIHTTQEEPAFTIPISEKPLNYYNNQIKMTFVHYNPGPICIEQAFANKKRIHVQIGMNAKEENIVKFFKDYIPPKVKHAVYFDPDTQYKSTCNILQKIFRNTAFDLVKCNKILEDVNNEDQQQILIRNYHEGKSNHRGINETELRVRRKYYWPTLKKDIEGYVNCAKHVK
ncbi:uncharacterized protein [Leptinotarsa decemlineata]|uniref:uncharacterized protein n=1 Tax=Leptinotarsa decemlineata TaxID=7539 RepID=UPI003D304CFB